VADKDTGVGLVLQDNDFTTDLVDNYMSHAVVIDRRDFSDEKLGQLSVEVDIIDSVGPGTFDWNEYNEAVPAEIDASVGRIVVNDPDSLYPTSPFGIVYGTVVIAAPDTDVI